MTEREESQVRIQECQVGLADLFDKMYTKHGSNFTTVEWHTATLFVANVLLDYERKIQYQEIEEPPKVTKP